MRKPLLSPLLVVVSSLMLMTVFSFSPTLVRPVNSALAQQSEPALPEPQIFAPGILSTGDYDLNTAFTPDGKTIYFTKSSPDFRTFTLVVSRFELGGWSMPEVAPFSGQYSDADPFISPDGKQFFFCSNRPVTNDTPKKDYDIWVMERNGSGWSQPRNLGATINAEGNEWYPSVTTDGTLYFSAIRKGGLGNYDLYRAKLVEGKYSEPENLGEMINSQFSEVDVYIAWDESFLVFTSYSRPDDLGGGDLYLSYKREGQWTKAVNLGNKINSAGRDFCPNVSPDHKYFFFTSTKGARTNVPPKPATYHELLNRLRCPGNGLGDIYRVDISALNIRS